MALAGAAVVDGLTWGEAALVLGVPLKTLQRWRQRASRGDDLESKKPGRSVTGITPVEEDQILRLADEWGEIDRSPRKLAARGARLGWVYVCASTVRRVLKAHGVILPKPVRPGTSRPRDLPDWVEWAPNRIWCWDATHFPAAGRVCYGIVDVVSRKWVHTVISPEGTSTQVRLLFRGAFEAEGLDGLLTQERLDLPVDDPMRPVLIAKSDNGPEMKSVDTQDFLTLQLAVWQHFGRPHTPTDQAWIESLWSHVKGEWPHLEDITDPAVLEAELARVRLEYNTVRLHANIGYVTPDDEHTGRGETIRLNRKKGMAEAKQNRIRYHQRTDELAPTG